MSSSDLSPAAPGPAVETGFTPHVLSVSSSHGNGGADRHGIDLARLLAAEGRARPLYACRAGEFTDRQCLAVGIPTVPFYTRNSGDRRGVKQLAHLITVQSVDIVHVHARRDFMTATLAAVVARRARRKQGLPPARVVLHVHLLRPLGSPPRLSGRFFQWGTDAVIAVSAAVEDYLNTFHGLPPQTLVRRIYNGVDLGRYAATLSPQAQMWRRDLRAEWGIPADAPLIGTVGRLAAKGQTALLAALPEIVRRVPQARVVFVGPEREKRPDLALFRRMAQSLGVADRVTLAGIREDIPAVMASLDALSHLPTDEAFGLVLVEAMAAGVPVVATNIGGCREVVEDKRSGLLVAPHDPAALADALASLLTGEGSRTRRQSLGAEGMRRAGDFSVEAETKAIYDLYTALCQKNR